MKAVAASLLITATIIITPIFAQEKGLEGWMRMAPRDEIKPEFSFQEEGGPKATGVLTIRTDDRDGLHGWWQKSFPITGGKDYRFHAQRRVENVEIPRRSAVARIVWQDDKGNPVRVDPPDDSKGPL